MHGRERIILFAAVVLLLILLPLTVKAQTENEMVQAFLKKYDDNRRDMLFVPFASLTYGFFNPDGYENLVSEINSVARRTDGHPALTDIEDAWSFNGGFGIVYDKALINFVFSWWSEVGSVHTGDFTLDLGAGFPEALNEDFSYTSLIQIFGVSGEYYYYLLNAPDVMKGPTEISLRIGGGIGYYGARWELWEGAASFDDDGDGEFDELDDKLTGSAPGFHIGYAIEAPVFERLTVSFEPRYQWLNFTKMSNRLSEQLTVFALDPATGDELKLDFSGFRAELGLKWFFTL